MSWRLVFLALAVLSCRKVPIYDVYAAFLLADATWFEEEQTLFVFYEVTAQQGLGDPSVVEITWVTDDGRMDWTPIHELPTVHTHAPVDCGTQTLCGSTSIRVPIEPRQVDIRLRYHRDGALALGAGTVFNVVGSGAPHRRRSMLVYGVFDELNERIQWRGRHTFPTLRNERAEELGLRRIFVVSEMGFGTADLATENNPYGYGVTCPDSFVATGLVDVQTHERAIFHPDPLPLGAADASTVCAQATVTDATGTFTTGAIARKNPEVRPAFPVLRSPVRDATPLKFFLGPCDRTISAKHEAMQRQRLFLEDVPTTCTEGWQQPDFVDQLVVLFRDAVEAERPAGRDMVLVIAVHQDEPGVSEAVEEALAQVAPDERHRSSPRLAGAFVLDSTIRGLTLDELSPVTLWCPAPIEVEDLPDASTRSCAIAPDNLDIELGPFSFGTLPILPSREQYLDFVKTYSVGQAGSVEELTFRAPEFATTSDHIDLGEFGVVTFLNNESITAEADDAFSYCVGTEAELVVFRSNALADLGLSPEECEYLGLPPDACETAVLTLDMLPDWHDAVRERSYEIGMFWEFPFLLRMQYELVAAGAVSAFGFSVPFGVASTEQSYYGTEAWTRDELVLADNLTQCLRFCDHPTFDSAGVYHVTDPFRSTYANTCYSPDTPEPGDGGFPLDP